MYKLYWLCLTIVLNTGHKKYEPLFTLQNLQWKAVSYILQPNSFQTFYKNVGRLRVRQTEYSGEGSDTEVPTSHLEEEPCRRQRQCVHAAPSFPPGHRTTFLSLQTVFLFCEEQLVHYWRCTLTLASFQKCSCLNYGSFKWTNSELGTSLWILGDIYQLRIQCMRTY